MDASVSGGGGKAERKSDRNAAAFGRCTNMTAFGPASKVYATWKWEERMIRGTNMA